MTPLRKRLLLLEALGYRFDVRPNGYEVTLYGLHVSKEWDLNMSGELAMVKAIKLADANLRKAVEAADGHKYKMRE